MPSSAILDALREMARDVHFRRIDDEAMVVRQRACGRCSAVVPVEARGRPGGGDRAQDQKDQGRPSAGAR